MHQKEYRDMWENMLKDIKRGTRYDRMPSPDMNLLLCWQHVCDMQVMFMSPKEKLAFKSSTYKFRNKNRNMSKTRKVPPSQCLANLYLFYSFV
jgi:hypothetical protein